MDQMTCGPVRIRGEILIDPPIPASELGDCEFLQKFGERSYPHDVRLIVVEEPQVHPEGVLLRRHAIAVVGAAVESDGRRVVADLQQIVDEYGAGRTFTGRLEITSDDMPQARVKVVDGEATQFKPTITWPGESE